VRERDAERRRLGDQRSVTVSGVKCPSTENALTVISRPGHELLDEHDARPRLAERELERRASCLLDATSTSPFWPCRSGALTTHG
jgi:hypothetical protein